MAEPILDLYTLFGAVPPRGAEPGTGTLKNMMAKYGVAGAVTLSTRAIYHSPSAGNRETQVRCGESGGTLLPAGALDPRIAQSDTLLTGARLICLFPTTQKWPLTYAPLENALKNLATRGVKVPLLLEATQPGDATLLARLISGVGYSGSVVLAGLSGPAFSEAVALAQQDERYLLCTDALRGVGEIAHAVGLVGANRVVFGSGGVARGSIAAALAVAKAAALSDADRELVLGGNTKRLLATGGAVA